MSGMRRQRRLRRATSSRAWRSSWSSSRTTAVSRVVADRPEPRRCARTRAGRAPIRSSVRGLAMLGSPVCDGLAVSAAGAAHGALGGDGSATSGCRGVFSTSCHDGECCAAFREDLLAPLADGIEAVAVHSRSDGDRRLAGVRRPVREGRRGRLEPLRHVGAPGGLPRARARARRAARRRHGMDESDRLVLPARRERHHADAHRRRQHLRGAAAAV